MRTRPHSLPSFALNARTVLINTGTAHSSCARHFSYDFLPAFLTLRCTSAGDSPETVLLAFLFHIKDCPSYEEQSFVFCATCLLFSSSAELENKALEAENFGSVTSGKAFLARRRIVGGLALLFILKMLFDEVS